MFMKHAGVTGIVEVTQQAFDAAWSARGWVVATQAEVDAFFGAPTVGVKPSDLVTEARLATQLAAAKGTYAVRQPLNVVGKMARGGEDVVIAIVGDSTGDPSTITNTFAGAIAAQLAAQFPAYTVVLKNINTTTLVYPAGTTVQTGTGTEKAGGPYTLTIYNGSKASTFIDHVSTNRAALIPVQPDLIVVNHGHNGGSDPVGWRQTYYVALRQLRNNYPRAELLLVIQNPRSDSVAAAGYQKVRGGVLTGLARNEGAWLVDVDRAFRDAIAAGTPLSSLLDGTNLHPSVAGQAIWNAEMAKHFTLTPPVAQITGPIERIDRLWIPATAMYAVSGSPTLGIHPTFGSPVWTMPDGVDSTVAFTFDVPPQWTYVTYAAWSLPTTDAGNVVWAKASAYLAGDTDLLPGGTPLTAFSSAATVAGGGSGTIRYAQLSYTTGPTKSPNVFQIRRSGTDALDTNAQAVQLHGVVLERFN